jgi:cyclin B
MEEKMDIVDLKDNKEEVIRIEDKIVDESKYQPTINTITEQTELNISIRVTLMNWLIEVSDSFGLSSDTLYLAVNMIDRFTSLKPIKKSKYQLVAITSLWIASKYEDVYVTRLNKFVWICDKAYLRSELIDMELLILETLNFNLTITSRITILNYYLEKLELDPNIVYASYYISELAMMDVNIYQFKSSKIAISSIYLSLKLFCNIKTSHNDCIKKMFDYTRYEKIDLIDCITLLLNLLKISSTKYKELFEKYENLKRNNIATKILRILEEKKEKNEYFIPTLF